MMAQIWRFWIVFLELWLFELVEELNFLSNYDQAKDFIQNIIDMPDRLIDLFIRFCIQNDGRLSARKHKSHFSFLTDVEVVKLEQAVQFAYGLQKQIE
jgi:hypothetical protein